MSDNIKAVAEYAVDQAKMDIRHAISTIEVWGQECETKITARHAVERIFEEKDFEADIETEKLETAKEVKLEIEEKGTKYDF